MASELKYPRQNVATPWESPIIDDSPDGDPRMLHADSPLRLLSTDLDGTLLDFARGVPADPVFFERLAYYREQYDLVWVINTGRWWDSLALEMAERAFPIRPDWLILTEREIYKLHHDRPVGDYTWNRQCAATHQDLFASVTPFWHEIRDFVGSQTGAELRSDSWSPVMIVARHLREADRIHRFVEERLTAWPKLTVVRNSVYFRFAHTDYTKGSCLLYLQSLLGVTPRQTLAAGDHYNDLPMLDRTCAHHLVCPGNSIPEVKTKVASQGGYVARADYAGGVVEGWDALLGTASLAKR